MSDYEKTWEQVQLDAAKAWANLDIAIEMIEESKSELTDEQYAEIQAKIEEQQKMIQDLLLQGKVAYLFEGGKDED
jgi:hypothetical protein